MLVRQSTYDALKRRAEQLETSSRAYQRAFYQMQDKWNALVEQLNKKGGKEFIENATIQPPQFTSADIDRLIRLCHPDRHEGIRAQSATEMTQKLLNMKKFISTQSN